MKKVVIENEYKERLAGLFREGDDKTLFILSHGYRGNKNDLLLNYLAERLSNEGFNSLVFDFSGHGESEGRMNSSGMLKQKSDLISIIHAFKGYEIILVGHSMGGAVSILSASSSKRVKGLVLLNSVVFPSITLSSSIFKLDPSLILGKSKRDEAFISTLEELEKKTKNTILKLVLEKTSGAINKLINSLEYDDSYFKEMVLAKPYEAIKTINMPLLMIHSKNDSLIPFSHAEILYANAKKPKKLVVSNYDHKAVNKKDEEDTFKEIIKWYRKTF
jgi:esterase/lipase